jgi:DNA-binding transcriptional MocR family regulator
MMTRASTSAQWRPSLRGRSGPRYQAIADAIEADVAAGRLAPGAPLPTQRELADQLGLNFTTVTRAYAEARRRGLLTASVGRGTFVAQPSARSRLDQEHSRDVDLSVNAPPMPQWLPATLRDTLASRLALDEGLLHNVLSYEARLGDSAAREAGASWLRGRGLDAPVNRVIPTAGAQHALSMLFAIFSKPGDTVLVESLAYPGLLGAAALSGVRLVGVPLDAEGVHPDALEQLCERHRPSLLFCVPTLQNPTTAVMSSERRRDVVAVARRHALRIVEDDICGPLIPEATPLAALAPDLVTHVASLSKVVAPGLRTAFVLLPNEAEAARLDAAVRTTILMLSPLPLAVATTWIMDGTAERVVADIRREASARSTLARTILGQDHVTTPAASLHAWLRLPGPWSVAAFVAQAQQLGVRVAPADWYVAPSDNGRIRTPAAVRITLGAEADRRRLEEALRSLASLIAQPLSTRQANL